MNVIEAYRKKHNITQIEFARIIGISQSYLAKLENGSRKPHPETAIAIEKATDGEIKKEWLVFPEAYEEEIRAYIEDRKPVGVEK